MATHPAIEELMASAQDEDGSWLTPKEASKVLKVSYWSILKECNRHHLPAIKIAGQWRISFTALQRMAEKNVIEDEPVQEDDLEQVE